MFIIGLRAICKTKYVGYGICLSEVTGLRAKWGEAAPPPSKFGKTFVGQTLGENNWDFW